MELPSFSNNQVALRLLSKFLSPKDLKNFRLVSTFWRDSSRETWRSSATVNLDADRPERIRNYVNFFRDSESDDNFVPISKYIVPTSALENQEEFWTTCGPHIKVLRLRGDRHRRRHSRISPDVSADTFFKTLYNFCPNLEKLILRHVSLVRGNQVSQENFNDNRIPHPKLRSLELGVVSVDITWTEFLTNFPLLESLRLTNLIRKKNQFFMALNAIRQANRERLPLTEFLVPYIFPNMDIPQDMVTFLLDPSLHLKRLSLCPNGLNGESNLKSILNRHGQSLRKLKLHRYDEPCMDPHIIFSSSSANPLMLENLRELQIDDDRVFSSFEFLRYVPNLQKLELISVVGIADMPGFTLQHCREFTVIQKVETQDLEKLIRILPNVEILSMPVNNRQFSMVCGGWPRLTNLSVWVANDSGLDDSGITGLHILTVETINEEGNENFNWIPYPAEKANILDLKHLRKFVVHSRTFPCNTKLGFCAAAYGVQQLSSLAQLSISKELRSTHELWKILHVNKPLLN